MARRALRVIAAFAAAACFGVACGGAERPSRGRSVVSRATWEAPPPPLDDVALRALIARVTQVRELGELRPIRVERLERERFRERVADDGPPPAPRLGTDETIEVALDLLPPPGQRAALPSSAALRRASIGGYYDDEDDLIVIPDLPVGSRDLHTQRLVLAHEVHHALQARNFPGALRGPTETDAALAHGALVEGDAEATAAAYLAVEMGMPVRRALRRVLDLRRDVKPEELDHDELDDDDRVRLAASPHLRDLRAFPYRDGAVFVTDLYRIGGFRLVDRAYSDPPRTSEQVLHPVVYLQGESARPVAPLPPPPGFRRAHGETIGELRARSLFRRCATSTGRADSAAAGWGGDRLEVFQGPARKLVSAWVSAWDTEADAREVEALLTEQRGCWSANTVEGEEGTYALGGEVVVLRDGLVVTLVRGDRGAGSSDWARSLAAAVGALGPTAPRLGVPAITRRSPESARGAAIDGDRWTSEWVGLTAPRPEGTRWRPSGATSMAAARHDVLLAASIDLESRPINSRSIADILAAREDELVRDYALDDRGLRRISTTRVQTHLGPAVERVWQVNRGLGRVVALVLPVCAEAGAIVIEREFSDPHGEAVLDAWLAGVRWTHDRRIPACAVLDPK